jgi:hypothetical protein
MWLRLCRHHRPPRAAHVTGRRKSASMRRMLRTRRRLKNQDTRAALAGELKVAYEAGASIRQLASAHRLAFGTVRTLLLEAGVVLRGRGGPNHARRKSDGRGDTSQKRKKQ